MPTRRDTSASDKTQENDLDKFLAALQRLMKRYPEVVEEVDVMVHVPAKAALAASSTKMAAAGKLECKPKCPPGKRCVLLGPSLQRVCFP